MKNKIIVSICLFLLNICPAFAVPADCFLVASGVYTTTTNTALVALPRAAKRIVYIQRVTAVSGTTPSMNSILRHSWSAATPATSNLTLVSASAVSTVGNHITHATASGKYVMPLPYVNINMTISGTTPSFTVEHYACYESRGE